MERAIYLIFTCMLLSAGCLTANAPQEENKSIRLITPDEGFALFDGQGSYTGIIGNETPDIPANYSMGVVVIPPGHATPLHRLLGTSEFVHVIGGKAEIRCDNTTVVAGEGETVILPEGVLQSIAAAGDTDLRYIDAIQPPFRSSIEISGDELAALDLVTNATPILIPDPREGIEWDYGSALIYTLANPVLMPEMAPPIDYSVAYAGLLPGGSIEYNRLNGSSEVIYVIDGEIEVFTPDGKTIQVPAGSAAYIPPDQVKGYQNAAASTSTILSFVDPAWTEERTTLLE